MAKTAEPAQQCHYVLNGPRMGRRVVLWRRQCRNRTRHPSGYCHVHAAWRKE